ncbi:MAG: SDR family NAD(P)-dependent oxidoreductase [Bdellovibrionota bacterium]
MAFVVITGASDGIGRELALDFFRRGFSVGLLARRKEKLEALADDCLKLPNKNPTQKAVWAELDVTKVEAQRKILDSWWKEFGGIDIFVANAGVGINTSDKEDSFAEMNSMIQVNLVGAIAGLEFLKPKMIARGHGTLVGVASIAGARGMPKSGGYCLTKAAPHTYLEALRMDVRRFGIKVCEVAPGYIDTAMTKPNKFHMPFLMKVERAALLIARKILRGKGFIVVPWQYRLAYPLLRNLPERLVEWVTGDGA